MPLARQAGLAAALVLLAAGCHEAPTAPPPPLRALPRELTATERQLITGSNAFAFSLLRAVDAQPSAADSNVFLSPLSASMALGMTANGAAGTTLDAMRSTLGVGDAPLAEVDRAYRSLIDLLRSLDPSVDFRIANSIWYRQDFPVESSFLAATRQFFDATVEAKDFADPSTVADINAWASRGTNGKIATIIDEIPESMVMYLINAIYFKGSWVQQFAKDQTRDGPFTLATGGTATVPFMRLGHPLPYAETATYQAVDLGYGRGAYGMTVLLPKPGTDVNALVATMDGAAWDGLIQRLDSVPVLLSLPRFRLAWGDSLNAPLRALGMGIAFAPGGADFTAMSLPPAGRELHISTVEQKTFVDVDEEGTEAAAATSVGVGVTSAPAAVELRVDHPFVFAIRERLSGAILFIGKIMRPPTG